MENLEETQLRYKYKKYRKNFGRQILFEDRGPEMLISIPKNAARYPEYILKNPVHVASQATSTLSDHDINTVRAEYACSGVNHVEGGWPIDVDWDDPDATQKHLRKVEKDDGYVHAVMHLGHNMEHNILQNNAMDLYEMYGCDLPAIAPIEESSCQAVNVYRDLEGWQPIRSLSWQCEGGAKLAVAHADLEYVKNSRDPQYSYIWDIENSNEPELVIRPPQPLLDFIYHPRDQNILIGGMTNGQVGWWDTRTGGKPAGVCVPYIGHRDYAQNVHYINSKTGVEFISSSPDGVVKWWDTRDMSKPTSFEIIDIVKEVTDKPSIDKAFKISALEYETTIPSRFMVGTETGLVIVGNRKGKNPVDRLPITYDAHFGPINALQRNPAFVKNFLTVGDWTAKVWSEDCFDSAILWTDSHRAKLTGGAWNPVRFSCILVTQLDGCLSCWDLLRRRSAPTVTAQLCDDPLLCLRPHEGGLLVACGSSTGTVYLAELSQNLGTADKNDKQLLTHVFDVENRREHILEAKMRDLKLKMRLAGNIVGQAPVSDPTLNDQDLVETTAEYIQTVKRLQMEEQDQC